MNKTILILLPGAAFFAAGYLLGDRSRDPQPAAGLESGVSDLPTATAGKSPTSTRSSDGTAAADDDKVRPFTPGRPFAKGHAREWLTALAAKLSGGRRDGGSFAKITPLLLTMDAECVAEAVTELKVLIAEVDARNPRLRIPNGDGRFDQLLMYTLVRMTQTDPASALEFIKTDRDHNDGSTFAMVLASIAADDLPRAEQWALSMDDRLRQKSLKSLCAMLDPAQALALAGRHPEAMDDHERKELHEDWARRDPHTAVASAAKSGSPEIMRNTIEEWAKSDPEAAAKWAASSTGPGSIAARASLLERRARENPEAALPEFTALQQASGDPAELNRLAAAMADAWADKDLPAARTWAETLPAGELRDRALHQVVESWVKKDAPAASEWIKALPPGNLRDGSVRELTGAISRSDPPGAFEWARNIQSEKLRGSALQSVLQKWREADPEAAARALESLPPEQRPKM